MTSEVVLMNKLAIAMAADSIVSIRTDQGYKTYNSVNKLFALSKEEPVGIMVYGTAELMGLPWEALIKEYRRKNRGVALPTVEAYADHFLAFLEANNDFFPETLQRTWFREVLGDYLLGVWDQLDRNVQQEFKAGRVPEIAQVLEILEEGAQWHLRHLLDQHAEIPEFTTDLQERMRRDYREEAVGAIVDVFEELPIPGPLQETLIELCFVFMSRDHFNPNYSGLVIAGFGESEIFPVMVSLQVEGVFLNKVRFRRRESEKISVETDAVIAPFAQQEMVHLFIQGIDPGHRRVVEEQLESLFNEVPAAIASTIPALGDGDRKQLKADLTELCNGWIEDFASELAAHRQAEHVDPLTRAVAALPKDELVALAESLVNLTSLKQRVSLRIATVGGPVDAAVISKGDGFIWIKRKHYFDPALNPSFFSNHYGRKPGE